MTDESIYEQVQREQEHYDQNPDSDEWEVVPPPAAPHQPKQRLRTIFSVRLSPQEAEEIRLAATAEGLTVSAFMRVSAVERARDHHLETSTTRSFSSGVGTMLHVDAPRHPANYSRRELAADGDSHPQLVVLTG